MKKLDVTGIVTIGKVASGGKREEVKGECVIKELTKDIPLMSKLLNHYGQVIEIHIKEIEQVETDPELESQIEPELDID